MKKYLLTVVLVLISLASYAQVNAKYLRGAVPEVDGKVLFTKTITPNKETSASNLFDALNKWAETHYPKVEDSRQAVLLSDKKNMDIACQGEDKLVFTRKFLILDQATMFYQLILEIKDDGKFDATFRNIKYDYEEEKNIPAEKMITDKVALKGEDKMYRHYDKFRILTIDTINAVFNSLDEYINGKVVITRGAIADNSTSAPNQEIKKEEPIVAGKSNASFNNLFREISIDKIPSKYTKALDQKVVISWKSKNDETKAITAKWNGTDNIWDKPVAFDIVNAIKSTTIEKGQQYTISFFTDVYDDALTAIEKTGTINNDLTPIGDKTDAPAFTEAWMIIECKKLDTPTSLAIDKNKGELQVGEILKVWVK